MLRKKGFTLVEMMVVVAIIGILVGMLFPALQVWNDRADRIDCMNNQRQLYLAVKNYLGYHKAFLPISRRNFSDTYAAYPFHASPGLWNAIGRTDRLLICPSDEKIWELQDGSVNDNWDTIGAPFYRAGQDESKDPGNQGARDHLHAFNISYCFALKSDPNDARYSRTPFITDDDCGEEGSIYQGLADTSPHAQGGDEEPPGANCTYGDGHQEWVNGREGVLEKVGYMASGKFKNDTSANSPANLFN